MPHAHPTPHLPPIYLPALCNPSGGLSIIGISPCRPFIPFHRILSYCMHQLPLARPHKQLGFSLHLPHPHPHPQPLPLGKVWHLRVNRLMFWQFEIRFWHFNPACVFVAADLRSVGWEFWGERGSRERGDWEKQRVIWGEGGEGAREMGTATQRLSRMAQRCNRELWSCCCRWDDDTEAHGDVAPMWRPVEFLERGQTAAVRWTNWNISPNSEEKMLRNKTANMV